MAAATGDWIGFLDADDFLMPGAMARRLAVIEAHPEAQWLAGNILVLAQHDAPPDLREMFYEAEQAGVRTASGAIHLHRPVKTLLHWPFVIQVGSAMLRRDLLADGLAFDASLRYGEDWYFWLLLAQRADLWWLAA